MDYRFFLTDRKTGERTEISEPVKFDGFSPVIKRGSYYGMVPDQSDSEIEFDRESGYALLKAAYDKYGVDAEIDFLCEYTCDGRQWEEYYSGQIDFATLYEERYQKWCRIAACITANDVRVTFLEKREDEIDLDAVLSRGEKPLNQYVNLGREISLPAKTIKTISEAAQEYSDGEEAEQTITVYRWGDYSDRKWVMCSAFPGINFQVQPFRSILHVLLNTVKYCENGEVYGELSVSNPINADQPKPAMYVSLANISMENSVLDIDISLKLSYPHPEINGDVCGTVASMEVFNIRIEAGGDVYNIEDTYVVTCGDGLEFSIRKTISLSQFEGAIDIKAELRAWVVERVGNMETGDNCNNISDTKELELTISQGSYVRLAANSRYAATPARTYMVHEALSRVAEYLTDGKLTVKSDFYGRTDSEVHRTLSDGAAGLRAVTNGYLIRRAVMTDGSRPKMFVSWKKLFESLQAIDNVGFCFEGDSIIRVEPLEYFYKDDVVLTCDDIDEHTVKFDTESNIRSVKTGYKKWLSDEYNSIDGFHTTREYHTPVEKSKVAKEYFSDLIADGYAIEATRRRQIEENSKDWQYDNDLFIIDLKRSGSSAFAVNTGATDTGGTLIDPDTIYNARLSPARMAMRHFADMTKAVAPAFLRVLRFGAAEGYAAAKMRAEGNSVIEKSSIVENQDISADDFANADALLLNASAEIMTFKYPIKPYEFRHIRENPYGLVDADGRLGWVKEVEWETGKETANFTLLLLSMIIKN